LGKGKGNKTGGRDFKPGKPGGGRPALPPEIKEARKLNQFEVEMSLSNHLRMNRAEISRVIKDPDSRMLDILVASIIAKAVQTGDAARLDFILNRTIGKVKEQIEITDSRVEIQLAYNPKGVLTDGQTAQGKSAITTARTIDVAISNQGTGESMASSVQVRRQGDA
jgi:hypothetical protein